MVALDAHVGAREERGGEADERGQRDQEDVERVDEELLVEREDRPVGDDPRGQRAGREEGDEAEGRR